MRKTKLITKRKFVTTKDDDVKKISDILYKEDIKYKVSVSHYVLSKEIKVTFTTEPIGEEIRAILAEKIAKVVKK